MHYESNILIISSVHLLCRRNILHSECSRLSWQETVLVVFFIAAELKRHNIYTVQSVLNSNSWVRLKLALYGCVSWEVNHRVKAFGHFKKLWDIYFKSGFYEEVAVADMWTFLEVPLWTAFPGQHSEYVIKFKLK